MRVLLVNKFLYPRGGAETYTRDLGDTLAERGHDVQYFGMYDAQNTMTNDAGLYVSPVDFHKRSLKAASYPFRIIYSREAYRKMLRLLRKFRPDIVHLNNFNYQVTPSVIDAARDAGVPVVFTAHDSQFVCPNHLLYNPIRNTICTRCVKTGDVSWCWKTRCIHGSLGKSVLGTMEGKFYRRHDSYRWISKIICPSRFMKSVYDTRPGFREKTVYLPNFVKPAERIRTERGDFVLYFGRISPEKGIGNIIAAARAFPDIPFVLAGSGPDEGRLAGFPNVRFVGFQSGDALRRLIASARLVVLPSTCYENCPLAVIEAQQQGAAVLAPAYGGARELVPFGIRSPRPEDFLSALRKTYDDSGRLCRMRTDSLERAGKYLTAGQYAGRMEKLYEGVIGCSGN